jgi:hypothetical protein
VDLCWCLVRGTENVSSRIHHASCSYLRLLVSYQHLFAFINYLISFITHCSLHGDKIGDFNEQWHPFMVPCFLLHSFHIILWPGGEIWVIAFSWLNFSWRMTARSTTTMPPPSLLPFEWSSHNVLNLVSFLTFPLFSLVLYSTLHFLFLFFCVLSFIVCWFAFCH